MLKYTIEYYLTKKEIDIAFSIMERNNIDKLEFDKNS